MSKDRIIRALEKENDKLREQIEALETENKRLHILLRKEVDDGRAEVDDMGYDAWLEKNLKG